MEKKCLTETDMNWDIIVFLTDRGYESILEKIILGLTPKAILAFINVSAEWCQIVLNLNKSKNPRIQKLISLKIDLEWSRKAPAIAIRHFRPLTGVNFINI